MKRPNVILISIDTLRADHLSCYGYQRETTPNIDKIASDGTIFRHNYSTGVWTPPGHASMLTGLYVSEHGVHGENRLHKGTPTIAETLKAYGYQTAGFVNNSQVGELVGFEKGHDTFEEIWKGVKPKSIIERLAKGCMRITKKKMGYEDMGAAKTCKRYREWLRNHIDISRSFYTFLHFIEPHNPLNPPRPFKNKYLNQPFKNTNMKKINKIADNPLICFLEPIVLNEEEIEYIKALYDGEIEYIDSKIGDVIKILKEIDSYDNTMIIITSDHGEHFGEHNLWSHVGSLYNEVLHIPLIIKFPKGWKYVNEVKACTQLVDIFPTVMKVVGVPRNELINTSGVSLVYDSVKNTNFHDHIFAEWEGRVPYFIQNRTNNTDFSSRNIDKMKNKMWMISDGTYKYISTSDGREQLYNLIKDRGEQQNLFHQSHDVASALKMTLNEFKSESASKVIEERSEMDEETRKNLERLGYM